MRQFEKLIKCPRCNNDISKLPSSNYGENNPHCPHCGHKIYCFFCGYPKILIKDDKWACPFIEGSGLHFGSHSPDEEENERWLREERFDKAGFTLNEYREVVKSFNKKDKLITIKSGPTTTSDTTFTMKEEDGWVEIHMEKSLWDRIYNNPWKENFKVFYKRMDWFLKWLVGANPDIMQYIYQEWLRSDSPCFGTWARDKMKGIEDNE